MHEEGQDKMKRKTLYFIMANAWMMAALITLPKNFLVASGLLICGLVYSFALFSKEQAKPNPELAEEI